MYAIPISDEILSLYPEGSKMVISPPDGDLTNETIAPIDAIVGTHVEGYPCIRVVFKLDDEEIERVKLGMPIMLTILGRGMPPVSLGVL